MLDSRVAPRCHRTARTQGLWWEDCLYRRPAQRPERFRARLLLVLAVLTWVIHRSLPTQGAPGRAMSLPRALARGQAPQSARAGGAEAPRTIETGPYIRSNADGIVENNLSYEGVRPPGTPEPSGYHQVGGHLRTQPDGIVENNLSYRGPAAEASNEPDEGPDAIPTQQS